MYDALYLQLAADVAGELATLDRDLARAARAEGVEVVAPLRLTRRCEQLVAWSPRPPTTERPRRLRARVPLTAEAMQFVRLVT